MSLAEITRINKPAFLSQKVRRSARQLNEQEFAALRLQSATLKAGRGQHRKYLPLAFTEHGAIMVATLLNGVAHLQCDGAG